MSLRSLNICRLWGVSACKCTWSDEMDAGKRLGRGSSCGIFPFWLCVLYAEMPQIGPTKALKKNVVVHAFMKISDIASFCFSVQPSQFDLMHKKRDRGIIQCSPIELQGPTATEYTWGGPTWSSVLFSFLQCRWTGFEPSLWFDWRPWLCLYNYIP